MKIQAKGNLLILDVKAVPNASRTQIAGLLGDALKIRVAQPPEDGKANRAIERLLAELLGIPPSNVTVIAGHSRPRKSVQIAGIPLDRAGEILLALVAKK